MQDPSNKGAKQAEDRLQLSGDRPKQHLADDLLGYANFARALARSIADLAATEGIVLAVNGAWGSGKTTAVNMIVEALVVLQTETCSRHEIVPIRFNPWWFSEQEDLIKAFFAELTGSVEKNVSEKVGEGFRKLARRVAASKELVIAGLDIIPGLGVAKGLAGAALGAVGTLTGSNQSLSQLRDDLSSALRDQTKRILVIIDDVDRLPADEVRQIFRLVKSVADLPNVIYLLIFDREIAERAFAGSDDGLGPKWHEKIVQAAFDLPPVQAVDIQRIFLEGINKLLGELDIQDTGRWWNIFHDGVSPWLRTPRDVGRLLNSLVVTWPSVARDVDFADFVSLETLRLFEPKLHAFIRQNPHRLTGLASDMASDRDGKAIFGEEILTTVDPGSRNRAKAALERLFPKLENIWGNHGYAAGFLSQWDGARQVCIARRFPAYFRFGIGDDVLSSDELEAFITHIADSAFVQCKVTEYADTVRPTGGTKAAILANELEASIDLVAPDNLSPAVINLFSVADRFLNLHDEKKIGFFGVPAIWRFWYLMQALLVKLDCESRIKVLHTSFASAESLQALRFALTVFRASLGRHPEVKPENAGAPLIEATTCEDLEDAMRSRLRVAALDGSLLASGGLLGNLHEWAALCGEHEVKAWTGAALGCDTSVVTLAKAATQFSQSYSEGDRVARNQPTVNRPSLEKVPDVDQLAKRLDLIAAPTPEMAETIRDFKQGFKAQSTFEQDGDTTDL